SLLNDLLSNPDYSEKFYNLKSLKHVVSGGDVLNTRHLKKAKMNARFYNAYGPTENTIDSTNWIIDVNYTSKKSIIGKPILNSKVYILDDKGAQLLPVGVAGKIYVSGGGVARGYLNREDLTSEKFMDNPFEEGLRMYDTGDLGRWLPDGNIEFLGRKDHQVKIRGFRIELGEIETILLQSSKALKQAVVVTKGTEEDKVLVAYYVSDDNIDKKELQSNLSKLLPDYMLPAYYVQLDAIPLTSIGKIDRKALPEISSEDMIRKEFVEPVTNIEKKLVAIWEEVLKIEKIGITDNFFELGGHSLIVSQVINRIQKQLGSSVSYKDFFTEPTIEGLSKKMFDSGYLSIPLAPVSQSYPLTSSQKRFWILSQLEEGSLAYNMPFAIRFKGDLNLQKFQESFTILLNRHEILRTSFRFTDDKEISQFITEADALDFSVKYLDFSLNEDKENAILNYLKSENSIAFDLEKVPLVRSSILKSQEKDFVFFISMHHIIGDGWSMELMTKEVVTIYNSLIEGKTVDLPVQKIQYKDYAVWINDVIQKEKYQSSEKYWLEQFQGELPVLELPSFKARPLTKTFNGTSSNKLFSKEFGDNINQFSKDHNATLFMTLLAGIKVLLHKYSGQNDIIIGTPVAGRDHPDLENQIGLYLNTLAIRTEVDDNDNFLKVLNKEKEALLGAYEHQSYPFDDLVGKLNLKRDASRSALFDVLVVLQNQGQLKSIVSEEELTGLEVENYAFENKTAQFDLSFIFVEKEAGLFLSIRYNTDIYDSLLIDKIFDHFENIINSSIAGPSVSLNSIDYLTTEEIGILLHNFKDTTVADLNDKTIIELFENQVDKTPDSIALVFEKRLLTYRELNERSNQLAGYLRSNYNIRSGDLVGVKLDRNENLIVVVLGILKSGAAYVPMDPNYPQDRIDFMVNDTQSKVVLDDAEFTVFMNQNQKYKNSNPKRVNKPSDLAYIIYTSGTTGKPKGVMIEHGNVISLLKSCFLEFEFSEKDTWSFFHSYCFDFSVWEIFGALLTGGNILILSNEEVHNQELAANLMVEHNVTVFSQTPSAFYNFVAFDYKVPSLRYVVFGGEALNPAKLKLWKESNPDVKLINMYGITETTVHVTYKLLTDESLSSVISNIGKPLAFANCYVLDKQQALVPYGRSGELYVSGQGVARGYLNRDDLNSEKFIENPFEENGKMYRTGDLARFLPSGELEYLGRIDDQVKIRGFRIELGEIESCLLDNIQELKQAVVVVKGESSDKYLVAYYVCDDKVDKKDLRSRLSEALPEYMVPSYYVELESIPLTQNGKVDRKSLPEVGEADMIKEEYLAPRTKEEQLLVDVWSKVLKQDKISVKDNFYNLGGDSIKSIQIVSSLKQQGYTLKIVQLLRNPVIEDLARLLELDTVEIDQSEMEGSVVLTPIQQFFFESEQIPNKNYYNQSVLLRSREEIDSSVLEKSIADLVKHHDALRMVYKEEDGLWTQYNEDTSETHYKISFYDLRSDSKEAELESLRSIGNDLQSGFDIGSGVLFHVGHFRMSDGDRLALIIHHLVIDGVSWRILFEDLSHLYESYQRNAPISLPLKTDSFQRWASVQEEYAKSEKMQSERLYWNEVSKEPIGLLPMDYDGGKEISLRDKASYFTLDKFLTEKLQTQVHHVYNTEINDILLTGLGLAVQTVFGTDKSVLKMEGHGREEIIDGIDIGRTVGWFTSVYPFVLDLSSSKGHELIGVKESLRKVPNKGVGYGILNYLDKRFDNELVPSIQFNYLGDFGSNAGVNTEGESLFEFSSENIGATSDTANNSSEILLDVSGMMVSDQLNMSIRYSKNTFKDETIAKLIAAYETELANLIETLSEVKENRLTPSDLTYSDLSYSDLAALNKDNNVEDIYELSPLQQGLYYHWLVDQSSHMYFEQLSYKLHFSNLSIEAVKQAYDELINRYAILRTSFTNDYSGVPLQIVHKTVSSSFSYESICDLTDIAEGLHIIKEKDKSAGFDLDKPTQMRLKVVELGDGNYEFIWSSHHILMDGWCLSILINDFYSMLMAITNGHTIQLPEPVKYSTYIDWLSKINKNVSLSYWKNYLDGITSKTVLPLGVKPLLTSGNIFQKKTLNIEGDSFTAVKNLCGELGITSNTFMQGVWGYLLSKYNNTQDVVVGSVVSGRPGELPGVENMVGLFINTIPVRIQYENTDTVITFLKKLHSENLESTPHHYLNLSEVQSQSSLGMDLINSLMIFENYLVQDAIEDEIEELYGQKEQRITIEGVEVFEQTNYDFNVIVVPSASSFTIEFKYNSSVFESGQIERLANHFANIVAQFSTIEELLLERIDYVTAEERDVLLYDFNDTAVAYPSDKTITELFEEQVENTPDNIAVVFEERSFTYRALNECSNQLAAYLRSNYSIASDDLIGIKLERSEKLIVAILGILKSGAAYVPIDPNYPQDRIDFIKNDTQSKVVIDEEEFSKFSIQSTEYSDENLLSINTSADLAYVMYTSGTTGNPKGVMVEHKNVVRLVKPSSYFVLNTENTLLSTGAISFDATILEYFGTLLNGSKLVLATQDNLLQIDKLKEVINTNAVDSFWMTASWFSFVVDSDIEVFRNVNKIIVGGDVVSPYHVKKLYNSFPDIEITNGYGPTENTTFSLTYPISHSDYTTIPLGKPISNSTAYILDEELHLVPVGVTGKIYVSGDGVARGYLNREDLTSEKFMENPFEEGLRMYDTGDLGRWLPDGNIEYLGRIDDQVKIRGFRIELGEIETILLQSSEELKQAVVVTKGTDEDKVLVAYYLSDHKIDKKDLKSRLSEVLPEYMVPSYYVQLDVISLTSNGKIDRKALPEVEEDDLIKENYIAPRTREEELLVSVWSEVLKRDQISVKDNFYNLGGDSIKSIQVVSRIKQKGYTLKVAQILKNPVV
ncbi:amino acid adenylation domain-containing protein, partial [Chryseobacterium proteolyticum]|uniref:amino acid adenylation domain-containing protein n=1 Tax=Chryseobacterium proteolyticum TaxID=118127 RepID=UPI0039835B09